MSTNYVMIDFENVQPKNLKNLQTHSNKVKIIVFLGPNQKVHSQLVSTMQSFGKNAEFITIDSQGKNALDFHLAYYLGKLNSKDPEGYYHIISKDTGFDPLVKHLRGNKYKIFRHNDITKIPLLKTSNNMDKKIIEVVKNLKGRGNSRPGKVKTLSNTINSLFVEKMNDSEMEHFITKLKNKKIISISGDKVSYNFKNVNFL